MPGLLPSYQIQATGRKNTYQANQMGSVSGAAESANPRRMSDQTLPTSRSAIPRLRGQHIVNWSGVAITIRFVITDSLQTSFFDTRFGK